MKIETIEVGGYSVNCYICYDEESAEAVVIDPGAESDKIASFIEAEDLRPIAIMLTHSHFDHICAACELKERYNVPICAFEDEAELLCDSEKNFSKLAGDKAVSIVPDILFRDEQQFTPFSNGESFTVIHTPGHTKGGCCYYSFPLIFTGDTLFKRSIGRTDLLTGSHKTLMNSIRERLIPLEDEIKVFPGHGPATTIGDERNHNPFFRDGN